MALLCLGFVASAVPAAEAANGNREGLAVSDEIWALEEAYFTRLYQADYDGVLGLVHEKFLGWPSSLAQPIGRSESARFMRQLIPQPTPCKVQVERAGMEVAGAVALTQYTLHVTCAGNDGAARTQTSRITHTWVRERDGWKLLGGMSYDK